MKEFSGINGYQAKDPVAREAGDFAAAAGFKGRNLVDVFDVSTAAEAAVLVQAKSDAKDYAGLRLGDYLEFPLDYGEGAVTVRYEIVAMGHYHYFYDANQDTTVYGIGNIVFLAASSPVARQIGTSTAQKTFFDSPMKTYLDGIAQAIEASLGVTIKRPRLYQQYNDGSYDEPDWSDDIDDDNSCSPKVFLPSIRELTGECAYGYEYGDNSHQFPLLVLNAGKIPVRILNGAYGWAWSRTPSRYPGGFCGVGTDGCSSLNNAAIASRVRLAWCL